MSDHTQVALGDTSHVQGSTVPTTANSDDDVSGLSRVDPSSILSPRSSADSSIDALIANQRHSWRSFSSDLSEARTLTDFENFENDFIYTSNTKPRSSSGSSSIDASEVKSRIGSESAVIVTPKIKSRSNSGSSFTDEKPRAGSERWVSITPEITSRASPGSSFTDEEPRVGSERSVTITPEITSRRNSTSSVTDENPRTSSQSTIIITSEPNPRTISESTAPTSYRRSIYPPTTEEENTYVEKYAKRVQGCGYLRMACQAIDNYLLHGRIERFRPTKVKVDAKYMSMIRTISEERVKEIVSGKLINGPEFQQDHLIALNKAREDGQAEMNTEAAMEVWSIFESEMSIRYPNRTPSGLSDFSMDSSTSKDPSTIEDAQQDDDSSRGTNTTSSKRLLIRKANDSDDLTVPRTRKSLPYQKSPLSIVLEHTAE